MASGDSTIRVNIIGDAKSLQKAVGTAEREVGGLSTTVKGVGAAIAAGFAADAVFDFAQDALGEFDRLGDATQRLELQLGAMADPLKESADEFSDLGQSAQDMLELEAAFGDIAKSLQLADPLIAEFADDAAATAAAIALMGDQDPSTIIDQIGKAAGGSERALKALGISLTDAEVAQRAMRDTGKTSADQLTDSETAAAAYALVLEKLKPKLDAITQGEGDLEQAQSKVQAKFETLTGKIGGALDGPLNELLDWTIQGWEGWELFAKWVDQSEDEIREFLTPLARAVDLLSKLNDLLRLGTGFGRLPQGFLGGGGGQGAGTVPKGTSGVTVNVNGGDPVEVQRAVSRALDAHRRQNNL